MLIPSTDLGSHVVPKYACGSQTAAGVTILTVAGATEDNVKVTGATIDRYSGTALADSIALSIAYRATLANTKTITFAVEYQDSADASTWNTAVVMQAATVAATGNGVATEFPGVVDLSLDCKSLERYVRFNVTPNLSATSTDQASWEASAILGGFDQLPV